MRYPKYKRYLVTDDRQILEYEEQIEDAALWLRELVTAIGAEGAVITSHVVGLYFYENEPVSEMPSSFGEYEWFKLGEAPDTYGAMRPYFMPKRNCKAGKQIFDRIAQWVKPTWAHFQQSIGLSREFEMRDGDILWANYERIGDHTVINVPYGIKKMPKYTVPINESDYWKIREEYEQ